MKYLIISLLHVSFVHAQSIKPEFKMAGQVDFYAELAQKPSSIEGQSSFDFALLQLSPELKVDETLSLAFRFVLAEERSTTEKNYINQVQNAFIRYQDPNSRYLVHELGLVRSAWIQNEGQAAKLDFFGDSGKSMARRYGFIGEGDLGYQGRYQQMENWQWFFGMANGEENKQAEQGPNKQAFIGGFYTQNDFVFRFWLSSGRVDRIDSKVAEKNRVLARAQHRWGRFTWGLEGVYAQDPSIDLEAHSRLEGIMFTELAEPQRVKTYGGRVDLAYDLSDHQAFQLRFDQLNPKAQSGSIDRKKIQSFEVAWLKRESDKMGWGAFCEKTDFGAEHSSQAKLRERVRLGIEIVF